MSEDSILKSTKANTSDEMCALVCVLVSNPSGAERKRGWQKTVNDLIRALRDERNAAAIKLARSQRQFELDCETMTRIGDERRKAEEERDEARAELARLRQAVDRMLPLKKTPA